MPDIDQTQSSSGPTADHQGHHSPSPKQAALINDALYPMPRPVQTARDILDQTGLERHLVLVRDYGGTHDHQFGDADLVDLRDGNVFKAVAHCSRAERPPAEEKPKLAFVVDDAWEVTLNPAQTGHSLKRLLGLPDQARLFRDLESPVDQPICDEEEVNFREGPVFTIRGASISVTVNTKPVLFIRRRVTALEVKETAIAQGVPIKVDHVLFRILADGSLGPAIRDEERLKLNDGDAFQCVAPDDAS